MTEERLRSEDDQRLPEGQADLPPENVEVVGRRRALGKREVNTLSCQVVELPIHCIVRL